MRANVTFSLHRFLLLRYTWCSFANAKIFVSDGVDESVMETSEMAHFLSVEEKEAED